MMSDQDAFERTLSSLYDAMLDDTHWPTVSLLMDEACGIQGNSLLVGTGSQDDLEAFTTGMYYRGQRDTDVERDYFDTYYPIDERVPRIQQLPDSRLEHITKFYASDEELQNSLVYNEILRRGSMQDSVHARLDGPDGSSIVLVTADPVAPDGWGSPQLEMIKGLLPHLRQFVRVHHTLARAGALSTSVTTLLDNTQLGVIQLDRRGQIMAANDRARDILRQGDGLTDRDGMLRTSMPVDQDRLERLVAGALPSASPAVSGSMMLRRTAALSQFVVHVKPVGSWQSDLGAQRVAALVLIAEPGRPPRIDPSFVASALGLTAAESQVAVWLAEGQTVRDIAAATGLQENSIYFHLKQVYQKQGISRQVDLVRLVLSITEFA